MAYQHIKFDEVDVGGGRVASEAWVSRTGPIALVETHRQGGRESMKSRLDLQKRVFLDPLPTVPSPEAVDRLIVRVSSR